MFLIEIRFSFFLNDPHRYFLEFLKYNQQTPNSASYTETETQDNMLVRENCKRSMCYINEIFSQKEEIPLYKILTLQKLIVMGALY